MSLKWTIIMGGIGIIVPLFVALILFRRMVRKEMLKDEMDRREQIRREEQKFY